MQPDIQGHQYWTLVLSSVPLVTSVVDLRCQTIHCPCGGYLGSKLGTLLQTLIPRGCCSGCSLQSLGSATQGQTNLFSLALKCASRLIRWSRNLSDFVSREMCCICKEDMSQMHSVKILTFLVRNEILDTSVPSSRGHSALCTTWAAWI